jgi:cell division protein FtsB
MNFIRIPQLIALVSAFFLLCGFEFGSNYKEMYQSQLEKTEAMQEQLQSYREENSQLKEEKARLEERIKALKSQQEDGLAVSEEKKSLDVIENRLNRREQLLNAREERLQFREEELQTQRDELGDYQRKIGEIEGRLPELRERKTELKEEVETLSVARQQAENGKNWWKNVALVEPAILMILFGLFYFLWRQLQLRYPQSSPRQTIDVWEGSNSNHQLDEKNQEKNILPNREEKA